MIILDSPFHVTFRSGNDLPDYACQERCKKVFWESDTPGATIRVDGNKCPQCGGKMGRAAIGVNYKIVAQEDRNLVLDDFGRLVQLSEGDKTSIDHLLKIGGQIDHLSKVKDKFIVKALQGWC